jgi:chromosomal replication initiator protein
MDLNLNDGYSFDNYFAKDDDKVFKIARKISEEHCKEFNPVLFYGGTGIGKTHLIQAIGHELRKKTNIIYTTGELLFSEFVNSVMDGLPELNKFRDKYYNMGALLIDDINFFQDKSSIQEELKIIFDVLYNKNIQMVFTSNKPLTDISGLNENIISRFNNGLIIEIAPLDYELKCDMINSIAKDKNVVLEKAVVEKIVADAKNDIRNIISNINNIKFKNNH